MAVMERVREKFKCLLDAMLLALQSLAAHLKLLLDTPEHLWRFLERKRFLHGAWLFLLARVIHRSLMDESADEGRTWVDYGIHVEVESMFTSFLCDLTLFVGKISSRAASMGDCISVQVANITQGHLIPPRAGHSLQGAL